MVDIEVRGDGLPVVVWGARFGENFVRGILHLLVHGYRVLFGENPSKDMVFSWEVSLPLIFSVYEGYPVIIEYPVLGGPERVDFIVVGKGRAIIVEFKAWRGRVSRGNFFVKVDGELRLDPCYQLENYIAKFRLLHSASETMEFDGLVFTHGFDYAGSCRVVSACEKLEETVSWLGKPGGEEDVNAICEGRFQISQSLIDFVLRNKSKLLKNAIRALLGGGYGLTEDQLKVVDEVLHTLESGEDKAFFIRGVSGSGKTLVALTLFFEAISRGYRTLLTYRNNRLLNTLRQALDRKLSGLIRFYSMGPQGKYRGVAERNFPLERWGKLDLVIYDEAQRMTKENIEISLERSRVKVYFYDDEQVLVGDEAGVRESFVEAAEAQGKEYLEYEFSVPRRIPPMYLQAVRSLLRGQGFKCKGIDLRIFDNIKDMIDALREKQRKGYRIALVCAFTETPGNKANRRAPDNLRIGYPLCKKYNAKLGKCEEYSDLNIYKEANMEIYWLMDERTEYPAYWMGKLDPLSYCASVYGAQGFEAEYVGVIWGRDLIWRGKWVVNPQPITDDVGGPNSLAHIARRNYKRALDLLKNRYLILLTRGTKGVYIYFEDKETKEYVKSLLN